MSHPIKELGWKKIAVLSILASLLTSISFSESAPVPAKLLSAKRLLLVNDRVYQPPFDKVYGWFKEWKRYELVDDESLADLIVKFSSKGTGVRVGGGPLDIEQTEFVLEFSDPKTKTVLWTEVSFYLGNVFKNFKKRIERALLDERKKDR